MNKKFIWTCLYEQKVSEIEIKFKSFGSNFISFPILKHSLQKYMLQEQLEQILDLYMQSDLLIQVFISKTQTR